MSYEFWDRDSLYEEVWATPMAKLAKKYGISDVGLAKVCRKLAIPVPGRGYWAKKEVGQTVQKLPLPALKEPVRLYKPTPKPEPPKIEEYTTPDERAQVAKVIERDAQLILKRGSMSHPLIVQGRDILGRSNRDGHDLLWTDEPCLDISVSKAALPRALRLAAGLITALEEERFKIAVKKGHKDEDHCDAPQPGDWLHHRREDRPHPARISSEGRRASKGSHVRRHSPRAEALRPAGPSDLATVERFTEALERWKDPNA